MDNNTIVVSLNAIFDNNNKANHEVIQKICAWEQEHNVLLYAPLCSPKRTTVLFNLVADNFKEKPRRNKQWRAHIVGTDRPHYLMADLFIDVKNPKIDSSPTKWQKVIIPSDGHQPFWSEYKPIVDAKGKPIVAGQEKVIFLDMDGTIYDFIRTVFAKLQEQDISVPCYNSLEHPMVEQNFPKERHQHIIDLIKSETFFSELQTMPYAVEGIKALKDAGYEIVICSTPMYSTSNSIEHKMIALEKDGFEPYLDGKIFIYYKDLVGAIGKQSYLIDDHPHNIGLGETASWNSIKFCLPTNKDASAPHSIECWSKVNQLITNLN